MTRETWDDNNFLPGDYSANPVLGLRLWRQAASPPPGARIVPWADQPDLVNEAVLGFLGLEVGQLEAVGGVRLPDR